ncbi:FemAB family XrtA/PEP-CTERM system-associated protein [Methylotuvimicrobium alcaliphilum]|uniref:FemAB-related protein, PEP-CTERM system-associated n=1 Tax=Methylotuvimicrobium alcaliphilum (strain DSM 19304 / NCIMB 14124 / VKM B-2133 / 20Z) TaxID=1091494 RepID=G4SXS3_META2|nr:FemAB family XrtA/PEP-CTERM system-associated protein [Methylotuvimicrobium alcaliphilum]CCE23117.1 FemAB-related protein, PEP-CTERM system-associated [Methylotuvimicrobium alcaliphilum 20Z]
MLKLLDSDNYKKWDAFVEQQADATFFHLSGWKDVIERAFGHKTYFYYIEKNGKVTGILPLSQIKSPLFGHALCSLSFCVYGGIVAEDEESYAMLDQEACRLAEQLNVDYLEMRNRVQKSPDRPYKELYVTFRKTLDPDPEKNMQAIPRKQRAMIRKGINAGLVSVIDQDLERFYQAYSESVRNLGTPVFAKKYFQILQDVFKDQCEILTVEKDGQLIASVMSFYFKDEILPYYGGGTDQARAVQGNDFMYWEVMRRAVDKGVKIFDYGRSKIGTGSYRFKKHWGFEPEPLFYEFHLVKAERLPDINPLNPKYRLFIAAWKRLPLPISQIVGPWLSKDLG